MRRQDDGCGRDLDQAETATSSNSSNGSGSSNGNSGNSGNGDGSGAMEAATVPTMTAAVCSIRSACGKSCPADWHGLLSGSDRRPAWTYESCRASPYPWRMRHKDGTATERVAEQADCGITE